MPLLKYTYHCLMKISYWKHGIGVISWKGQTLWLKHKHPNQWGESEVLETIFIFNISI